MVVHDLRSFLSVPRARGTRPEISGLLGVAEKGRVSSPVGRAGSARISGQLQRVGRAAIDQPLRTVAVGVGFVRSEAGRVARRRYRARQAGGRPRAATD